MKFTKSIDRDCKSLKNYFQKKFELMELALEEERLAPIVAEDADSDKSQAAYHGFSHFIIPDMVINIYSLLEWWLKKACEIQRLKKGLSETYNDIRKAKNDFDRYHKYLVNYIDLDLNSVEESRVKINSLREVRNRLIHHGGDISGDDVRKYSQIDGVSVISLQSIHWLNIEDKFIWDMLNHVQRYLHQVFIS